jgi:UDP-glucose 4-epimerase
MSMAGTTLVLGASGFAGAAIAAGIARKGGQVLAYGRTRVSGPGIEWIQGSIEDSTLLREAIARCSCIVHAASLTTPGSSARDPTLEVLGNLLPLARTLEWSNEFPDRRFIYLSSGGAVYGDLADGADEGSPLRPRSYYGAGKVAAEALVHACVAATSWSACILRPSNLYGPGQRTGRGFAIVPTLFERALDGTPFQIWGDGTAVRDYCYIEDLVDAFHLALTDTAMSRFSIWNVASACTASILDLVATCERISGRSIALSFTPARSVDVPRVALDVSAIGDLGWRARIDLEEGLRRTWQWFMSTRADAPANGKENA